MLRKALFTLISVVIVIIIIIGIYSVFYPLPPVRFPQFNEYAVAGLGVYQIPQWSPDSRYLAFLDVSERSTLKVYDTQTTNIWDVANTVSSRHFSWMPNGKLTYLKYRPDLSGSSFPEITDLHQIDLNAENDKIVVANLSSAGTFDWFKDGRLAILLKKSGAGALHIFNVTTNTIELVVEAADVDLQDLLMFTLSPDEKTILINGLHERNGKLEAQIIIYNFSTKTVLERFLPSKIIPSGNMSYPVPAIGDDFNFGWVGGQRWFLTSVNTPGGSCYNYALYFFDTQNLQNSFCIPTVDGIVANPAISPDLTKISYITVLGAGNYYLMIGTLPSDLLAKLELDVK